MKFRKYIKMVLVFPVLLWGCYPDESLDVPVNNSNTVLETELDQYIEENFTNEYGMAIRYKFVDQFVQPGQRVTPPRLEVVRPMLDFIEEFWIEPYLDVANGEEFFRANVPAEIVFLGGLIFNEDGTVTLGTADAGAQITFTDINAIDRTDQDWVLLQLRTVYHEFAHVMHQRNKLPVAYETISSDGYTSPGSWFNLTNDEALQRGFVSPYASSSPNEDFAEVVAFFLFDPDFENEVLVDEDNCTTPECALRNEGRERIRQKLNAVRGHYQKVVGVDLDALRFQIQSRL